MAPKLRQQQADPVTPLLGQFGGEEPGRQEAHKLSHSAAYTRDPPGPAAPKAGLKTAGLTAAESATDPFFFSDWNIGKFPINIWAPCFSHKIRRSSEVSHHFFLCGSTWGQVLPGEPQSPPSPIVPHPPSLLLPITSLAAGFWFVASVLRKHSPFFKTQHISHLLQAAFQDQPSSHRAPSKWIEFLCYYCFLKQSSGCTD